MRHGRRRITWSGTALVLGAVTAGCALVTYLPQDQGLDTPVVVEGVPGETLDLTYAELTVTDVRVADTLEGTTETAVAGGTFLVVDVTWRATRTQTTFAGAEVTDSQGRRFWPSALGDCAASATSQPGYAWRATYCFDVPEDALAGATVRLARGSQSEEHAEQRRDAVAVVDLGITAGAARTLWDAAETVRPEPQGFAVPGAGDAATGDASTGDASTGDAGGDA
ncbi:DUF4352 domain-containing protein [Promicromonospora thailandica]|uniref:Uncharacterized protein n=1 Tax=Promicromonospora thailandica TaxID=765201 RepID=A0A9X2G3P8_9MICO|nr:DUF4352 domain-containing protein [Promicromonospora thailandica]MCP2264913.1 hypothetical protein [Promicromonospora thailandica]BFF18816.1 hypothetical protein GCM10025730_23370 [Promicromonospora thailandica]